MDLSFIFAIRGKKRDTTANDSDTYIPTESSDEDQIYITEERAAITGVKICYSDMTSWCKFEKGNPGFSISALSVVKITKVGQEPTSTQSPHTLPSSLTTNTDLQITSTTESSPECPKTKSICKCIENSNGTCEVKTSSRKCVNKEKRKYIIIIRTKVDFVIHNAYFHLCNAFNKLYMSQCSICGCHLS